MKKIITLLALLLPALATADISLSWTNATSYTDGTPMPVTDLASTTAWCGASLDSLTLHTTVTAPNTSATVAGTVPGTPYVCAAAHTAKNGKTSDFSPSVSVGIPVLKPSPPLGISATLVVTSTVAYMELQRPDGFGFLVIGSVPIGTPCDATQSVNQYHVVPAAAVTFTGPIKRQAVLALCG
jgi:hypothetical protein